MTQFAAVREGSRQFVKQRFADDILMGVSLPDFRAPDEVYALLADLRLPIYVTTNYDDFMYEALKDRGRSPQRAICPCRVPKPRHGLPPDLQRHDRARNRHAARSYS